MDAESVLCDLVFRSSLPLNESGFLVKSRAKYYLIVNFSLRYVNKNDLFCCKIPVLRECGAIMGGKKKTKKELPIFDSIRKPTAPPSRRFGEDLPTEKSLPSGRKSKHKKKPETTE